MKIQTKAVHAGDRKRAEAATFIPVTTPIHTAASYFYESMAQLDRVFGEEEEGYCYARYDNPTNAALEELMTSLEGGHGALACSSGMAALHMALLAALTDRRNSVLAANALYGATTDAADERVRALGVSRLRGHLRSGCAARSSGGAQAGLHPDGDHFESAAARGRDRSRSPRSRARPARRWWWTTPSPRRCWCGRWNWARTFSVHSVTKYLAGHGDVLGGVVVTDRSTPNALRALGRTIGPGAGPVRKLSDHARHQDASAAHGTAVRQRVPGGRLARSHPRVERVYFPADPQHPDAAAIRRLFPAGLYGAMVSFELKDAGREEIFRFMDGLQMVVRATSLGDVHTMMLYPAMSSHRELSPKHRQRMGIRDNLVRLSVGIEAAEDIIADLEQALA